MTPPLIIGVQIQTEACPIRIARPFTWVRP